MITQGTGASDTGRRRSHNEDSFAVDDELGLYVVADGMGGRAGGEVASRMAISVVRQKVGEAQALRADVANGDAAHAELATLAEQALLTACAAIHERAQSDPELAGMGCTMTMLLTAGVRAAMAHVGDSRLYLLRDGSVSRLSTDHSFAGEMVRAGVLSPEKARAHPYAHVITRAVGLQPAVEVDTLEITLAPGDRFLICSDGLADYVDRDETLGAFAPTKREATVSRLIALANERGGADNITVVLVDVASASAPVPSESLRRHRALAAMSRCPLFEGFPLRSRARLLAAGRVRHVAHDERLLSRGDPVYALFVCLNGHLEVRASGQPPVDVGPGAVFGYSTLFHERPARATVIAQASSEILVFDRGRLMRTLRMRPRLGVATLERLLAHGSRHEDPI